MRLGTRSLILPVVLAGFALAASAVPRGTWPGTALPSLGSGVVALSLMAPPCSVHASPCARWARTRRNRLARDRWRRHPDTRADLAGLHGS